MEFRVERGVNLKENHFAAEVVARRDVAPDLWVVRVRPEKPLDFRPGQFATVGVLVGTKMIERPYSIASSPRESELEFFLERVPEGQLSERLHELVLGNVLYVRKATKGNFTFDDETGHKTHLMVATVTGVAPFVSMVRTLRLGENAGEPQAGHGVFLLQGASRSWELGYEKELADLEHATRWFRYLPTVSRPQEDVTWERERGRVHELILKSLDRFQCNPSDTTAYLCGHPGMIETGKKILRDAGFALDSIREERYWVPNPTS